MGPFAHKLLGRASAGLEVIVSKPWTICPCAPRLRVKYGCGLCRSSDSSVCRSARQKIVSLVPGNGILRPIVASLG
jgi:hypothetical protein